MGGGTKESNLLDLVRSGDSQTALKILFKNKPKPNTTTNPRLRSMSVDCHNNETDPANRLRYIDLSSFKLVYDTNEFRVGQKNLLPRTCRLPPTTHTQRQRRPNPELFGTLGKSKLNVNYQDEAGKTLVHEACISNSLDIIRLLIESGAKLDLYDKSGFLPFHYACQHARTDILAILVKQGINCNEPTLISRETGLHLAVHHESESVVSLLIANGGVSSVNISSRSHGLNPFELACELGRTRLVNVMLRYLHANDLSCISKYSLNSLHLAAKNGHNDIIRLLLIYKVTDINRVSPKCEGTALHEACRYGRLQTVKLLLECGVDSGLLNEVGQSALEVVIRQKVESDIKCLIREYEQSVRAVSSQAYRSKHSGALNFEAGEVVVVLERPIQVQSECSEIYSSLGANVYGGAVTSLWRGFILNKRDFSTRSGYFPASFVDLMEAGRDSDLRQASPCSSSIYGSLTSHSPRIPSRNVVELIRQGMTDSQIIFSWLADFNMQHYYTHFVQAGYDLLTIFKSTPADLCAIGVDEPENRLLIKQNMYRLDISELETKLNLLLTSVSSIDGLLQLMHLEQYSRAIREQNIFRGLSDFANTLTWEDLEEVGVNKLGHQKKLMLVAKRLKDVLNNKLVNDQVTNSSPISKPVPPKRKAPPPQLPPRKSSAISQNNFQVVKEFLSSESSSASGTISPSSTTSSSSVSHNAFEVEQSNPYDIPQKRTQHTKLIENASRVYTSPSNHKWPEPEENALSDIDSMLFDLNKQLDDMLVGERVAKS